MPINIMSKREYDKIIKTLKKDGEAVTTQFSSLVLTGVSLYWGESNNNIQVINDLIDCARVFKGLRVKAVVEYLNQTIPHANGGQKSDFHYGKLDKKARKAMEGTWEQFLNDNPDWDAFTIEKDPSPFNLLKFVGQVTKAIQSAHEKDEISKSELKLFKQAVGDIHFSK